MERKYTPQYRSEWEKVPEFTSWLCKTKDGLNAHCKACDAKLLPRMASLKEHAASTKHKKKMIGFSGSSKIDQFFKNSTLSDEVKKAEIKIVSTLVEHNIPFLVMDHLSGVLSSCFHDSEIAKRISCRRTKSSAIAYNVLGGNFKQKMIYEMKSGSPLFSIIIDESTDVSTKKILAIAVKYYSNSTNSVKTKYFDSVNLEGETAQHLFDALNEALKSNGFAMHHIMGFAADTTNVMFGEHNGIVAKIHAVNPHCVFIKCVCHSAALAVSHACKLLPRNLEILIKEVYNYFSQSSKRQREFQEFQEFTQTESHKILRHYDIRWLSLHSCINRVLEQWSPLKLFFQSQYLDDMRQHASCEFLFHSLNDNLCKLYLYFLDFILPIVNKFNIIFQGDYPVAHRFHRDMSQFLLSIFSCFMENSYLKNTPISEVDPKASIYHLPLKNMYLGVHVARLLQTNFVENIPPQNLEEFFSRCQSFLIELCSQLRKRLPLDNEIFKELRFLDPQVAAFEEFSSLMNIMIKFPNIVPENNIQNVDNEYRDMKLDHDVANLLASSSTSSISDNIEQFWLKVGLIKSTQHEYKYSLISNFAKQMMCLPVSNVKCERIFSEFNRIKTDDRNKFLNQNVSSIIHAKEGLKDVGGCNKFDPGVEMIKSMDDKILYKNLKYEDQS